MAQRGREAQAKRARERARQARKDAKRERRESASAAAADDDPKDAPDESELMEEFRVLSERHAAGLLSEDLYAEERHRIFAELGIETDDVG